MIVLIKNLYFNYFNIELLKNINIEVNNKEFILLVGDNGAGKSTLLRIIGGKHCIHKI